MQKYTKMAETAVLAALVMMMSFYILLSCQGPFVPGLGDKVDIDAPTVRIHSPQIGSFISDKYPLAGADTPWTFTAQAWDDMSVAQVDAAFNVIPTDLDESRYTWLPGTLQSKEEGGKEIWVFSKSTIGLLDSKRTPNYDDGDGQLYVWLRAADGTKKKGFSDILDFEIKNNPPKVSIQVPPTAEADLTGYGLEIITGTNLIGNVRDRQGIMPGYPRVKFWKQNTAPGDFQDSGAFVPRDEAGAGWIVPDINNNEFSFLLAERGVDGNVILDSSNDPKYPLPVYDEDDPYYYRVQVQDLDGRERLYPDPLVYPDGAPIRLIAQANYPDLLVTPDKPEYVQEKTITAQTRHTGNTDSLALKVFVLDTEGIYSGGPAYANTLVQLEWDTCIQGNAQIIPNGGTKGWDASLRIPEPDKTPSQPGPKIIDQSIILPSPDHHGVPFNPPQYFDFVDGEYDFTIQAVYKGIVSTKTVRITVDRKAPEVSINDPDNELVIDTGYNKPPGSAASLWEYTQMADPTVPLLSPDSIDGIPGSFVSGRVEISVSITPDLSGIEKSIWFVSSKQETTYTQVRLKELFEDPTAAVGVGDIVGAGELAGKRFDFDSTISVLGSKGTDHCWAYVISKDRAGNYGYAERELLINQRTDIPVFSLPNMDRTVNDPLYPGGNVLKEHGTGIRVQLQDNAGVAAASVKFLVGSAASGAAAVPVDLSGSGVGKNNKKKLEFTVSQDVIKNALGYNSSAYLPDGTYYFSLEYEDIPGSPANKGGSGKIYFAKDTTPPAVKLTGSAGVVVKDDQGAAITDPDIGGPPSVKTRYANGKSGKPNEFTFELEIGDSNALGPLGSGAGMYDSRIVVRENGKALAVGASAPAAVVLTEDAAAPNNKNTITVTRPIGGAANAIADGEYTYTITVYDRVGNTAQGTYNVRVDTTAPVVSVTSPARGFPSGVDDSLFINGTAAEAGSGLKEIWYKISGAKTNTDYPAGHPSYTAASAGWYKLSHAAYSWSEPLSFGAPLPPLLGEGAHYLYIYALDNADNWSAPYEETPPAGEPDAGAKVGRRFIVDLSPPELTWAAASSAIQNTPAFPAAFDGSRYYANGTFSFEFKAYDSNELRAAGPYTVTRAKGGGAAAALTSGITEAAGGTAKEKTFRVSQTMKSDGSDDGEYTYTVTVYDQTNKQAAGIIKIVVDHTGPWVDILTPAASAPPYSHNAQLLTITGTAKDKDNLSPIAEVRYKIFDAPLASTDNLDYSSWTSIPDAGQSWVYNHDYLSDPPPEGAQYLYAVARDAAGNWGKVNHKENTNYSSPAAGRYFEVDSNPPYITWAGAGGLNPAAAWGGSMAATQQVVRYTNDYFSISFNVGDTNGLAAGPGPAPNALTYKIERKIGNGAKMDITGNAVVNQGAPDIVNGKIKNIMISVNESPGSYPANEEIEYTITTTDVAMKASAAAVKVVMDRDPPTVDITKFTQMVSGGGRDDNVNGRIEFVIASSDLNGVSRLKYWILPSSAMPPVPIGWSWQDGAVLGDLEDPSPIAIPRPAVVEWDSKGADTAGNAVVSGNDYCLYILAVDPSGNMGWLSDPAKPANKYWNLHVDQETDKPVITVTTPSGGSGTVFVNNAKVLLQGRVSDDDGIRANNNGPDKLSGYSPVEYRSSNSSAAPTGAWTEAKAAGTGNQYQAAFESNGEIGFTGDGEKVIQVRANDYWETKVGADKTGKASITSDIKEIRFILDTTKPALTITSPAADETFRQNYNSSSAPLGFRTTGNAVELYLYSLKVSMDGGAYQDITSTLTNPGDGQSSPRAWEYTIGDAAFTALAQGVHTLTFEALDKAGNVQTAQRVFYKDTTAPEINFGNIKEQVILSSDIGKGTDGYNGKRSGVTQLEEANAALRGTFSDEYSPIGYAKALNAATNAQEYYFEYRIYNRDQLTGTVPAWDKVFLGADPAKAPSWAIPLTGSSSFWTGSAGLPDGLYWLDIRAADRAGNDYTNSSDPARKGLKENTAFALDRSPPEIALTTPAGDTYTSPPSGIVFSITGTASDANFKELRVRIDGGAAVIHTGGALGQTMNPQAKTYSFTRPVQKAEFDALADGPHTITFSAEDDAGRITEKAYSFYKDTTAPALSLSNIEKVQLSKAEVSAGGAYYDQELAKVTMLTDPGAVIRGSFTDEYSRIGGALEGGERYFEYRIYNRDNLLKDTIPSQWEKALLGADPGKTADWTIPLALPDGLYWLDIRVKDRLGNHNGNTAGQSDSGLTANLVFAVDRDAPEIKINEPQGAIYGVQTGDVFTLTGTIADANLSEALVRVDSGADAPLAFTAGLNPVQEYSPRQLKNYTLNWTLSGADFAALGDGQHSVTVTARDSASRTAVTEWVFHKDTKAPALQFLNLNPAVSTNNFQDTAAKIQGAATDEYGVYSIETRLEKFDYTTGYWAAVEDKTGAVSAAGFTTLAAAGSGGSLGNNKNWTKDIGAPGGLALAEGRYRITVRVTDRAGPDANVSLNNIPAGAFVPERDEVVFVVDYTPPVLRVDATPPYSNGDNKAASQPDGFFLTGTASDNNGLHPASPIQVYLYDGPNLVGGPFTGTTAVTPRDYFTSDWTALIPQAGGGSYPAYPGLKDGKTYTIQVTAQDSSTKTTTVSRDITYDTTPPTSNIYAPALYQTITGQVDIRGESGDDSAVKLVEYKLGVGAASWEDTQLNTPAPKPGFKGGLYAWSFNISADDFINIYTNSAYSDRITVDYTVDPPDIQIDTANTSNLWRLPFAVRVTDAAGNTAENPYFLILDPDGDIPRIIEIRSPSANAQMGGVVRAQGTAQDDGWIHAVLVRTYKGNAKDPAAIVHYPVNPNDTRETNADGWALASITTPGSVVNWSYNLNQFGELNGPNGNQQYAILEVMPVDSKLYQTAVDLPAAADLAWFSLHPEENRLGVPKDVLFTVNAGAPAIENIKVKRTNDTVDYQSGIRAAGEFTITADMTAGDSPLSKIQWKSGGFSALNGFEDMLDSNPGLAGPLADTAVRTVKMPATVHNTAQMQAGRKYFIKEVGDTDWAAVGVLDDPPRPGSVFLKNGTPAAGSGTAYMAEGGTNVGAPWNIGAAYQQRFVYPVTIKINSLTNWPNKGTSANYSSGVFLLDFLVEDYREPYNMQVQTNLSLQIDNYYPTSTYRAPRNASTRAYWVQGQAVDTNTSAFSGPIEGIKEVLAYFRQNNTWYNPNHDVMTPVTALRIKDMNNNGNIVTFNSYPDMTKKIGEAVHLDSTKIPLYGAVRIDRNEVNEDTDKDGYIEQFSLTGGTLTWGFQFDTTKFADGPLELHYIVIDDAGNSTHYKQDLSVRNNPPVIRQITLKTDYNYDHIAGSPGFPAESVSFAPADRTKYQKTDFTARNYRLTFEIETQAGSGTGDKTFRVLPVSFSTTAVQSTKMTVGRVYVIDNPGNTDWASVGAPASLSPAGTIFVCTDAALSTNSTGQATTGTVRELVDVNFKEAAKKTVGGIAGAAASISYGTRSDWTQSGLNTDGEFGEDFERIPDSKSPNDKLFLVKVFDSTIPGGAESAQAADVVVVGLTIANVDHEKPAALIDPFFWKSETDNSLYGNSRENGHIELPADLPAAFTSGGGGVSDRDPKVSGRISLRGTASDDTVVDSIWVLADGFKLTGAFMNNNLVVNGDNWYRIAEYSPSAGLVGVDQWAANGWRSVITTEYLDQRGHRVKWQLDIDTHKRTGGITAADQVFRIVSIDGEGNLQDGKTSTQTGNTRTNYYRMDVVPYISEVVTRLSSAYKAQPSAFNRSALGWYPVREEETIEIKGFNFSGAATAVSIGGTALDGVQAVGGNGAAHISARVDNDGVSMNANTIASGDLEVVSANGMKSLNNLNNTAVKYNQEPNGVNNETLTNARRIYVWSTGAMFSSVNSNKLTSPFMRMNPSGIVYMSYGSGATDMVWNKNGSAETIEMGPNKYHNTTVAFDNNGYPYAAGTNTDRRGDLGLGSSSFTYFQAVRHSPVNGTDEHYLNRDHKRRLELAYSYYSGIYDIERVQVPRIVVKGTYGSGYINSARDPLKVYMTYADGNYYADNLIVSFRYQDNFNPDYYSSHSPFAYEFTQDFISNASISEKTSGSAVNGKWVASNSTNYKGGVYTAVGALSDGRAVIAWNDASRNALILTYSQTTNPDANGAFYVTQWQDNAKVIDDDLAGWYVDMAVDASDGIHLAYYANGGGGLRYAYLSSYTAEPQVVRVDTYLSAGTKLMLNVRKETRKVNGSDKEVYVPYISYYHGSFLQTMNAIRVAWREDFSALKDGTDLNDKATGAWEFMTVPTQQMPNQNDYVCNGVATSGTYSRSITGQMPLSSAPLKDTVLLGYHTDVNYESAYLKK